MAEADASRPGSWGIKEAKGREGKVWRWLGGRSLGVVSRSYRRPPQACPPAPGMPFPPPSPAWRTQLLSPSSPGEGRP